MHDVKAHDVGFLNQGCECPVTASGIGGDDEATLVSFQVTERSEREIGGGVGEDTMGIVSQSGEDVLRGGFSGG